jgi:primosomal protein N' (replication factor Y)
MAEGHASTATERSRYAPGERVAVLLPLPLAGPYEYRVAAGFSLEIGAFVEVALGRRQLAGVVWGPGRGEIAEGRLREVCHVYEVPALPAAMRRFVDWVAAYTVQPPGAVLKMVLSVPEALIPPRPTMAYRLTGSGAPAKVTAARKRVLDLLAEGPPRSASELTQLAGVSPAVVKGLAEQGAITAVAVAREEPPGAPSADPLHAIAGRPSPQLSPTQSAAATAVRDSIGAGFQVTLIDGVAGSGKTEVYFEAIARAFEKDRQVLVLLPEIALSAQWLARFHQRFGIMPAQWHSELGRAQRRRTWRQVAEGRERVVVGARSALFLPFAALGLIVVDEEHDPSFKQEDGVAYHARDMAVVRGRIEGVPVLLVSATPSLETFINVTDGRYRCLHLPERHGGAVLPDLRLIDLKSDRPKAGAWLSPTLAAALAETVAAGEQALLFLNRRGYAPLTLCRACGHRLRCPHCTAWLVEHRLLARLQCHHCGHGGPLPVHCPRCGAEGSLAACGPGVERIFEEAAALLPQARMAIATSDTLTGPGAAAALVERIERHELDVIVGTQVVAKGYHFPLLTLVGVVDADIGLSGGDLRAAERTFQLLAQVAGRAGREARPGRALLQTTMPAHPVMKALISGDRSRFFAVEAELRREAAMPPFGRLAALIVSGGDEATVDGAARSLARTAPTLDGVQVLGPAPPPLALLRGRHRRRLLLSAPKHIAVSPLVRRWLQAVRLPASVRVQVDIDPMSFL